jgi:hypothetical protein
MTIVPFPKKAKTTGDGDGPLYVGIINGRPVRFFRSPLLRPEVPWISQEDLMVALGFPRRNRRELMHRFRADARAIGVGHEQVFIIDRDHAKGLIGAAIESSLTPNSADADYNFAAFEATNAHCAGWNENAQDIYKLRAVLPQLDSDAAAAKFLIHPFFRPDGPGGPDSAA